MTSIFDCIVVGGGVEGSATAYKLAESGQRTLLLEQFSLLHENGSSHGESRVTRCTYADKNLFDLAVDNFDEWEKVEKLCGKTVYVKTGSVAVARKPSPSLDTVIENLRRKGVPHRVLVGGDQIREVMPNTTFPDDYYGVHDERGGAILATKALACFHELVRNFGGEIQDNWEVVDIVPGVPLVTVKTKDGRQFQAKNLVLCPGTWAGELGKKVGLDLPVTLLRVFPLYWKEKVLGSHSAVNKMPTFIDIDNDPVIYGIPSLEYPGYMKIPVDGGYKFDFENPHEHDEKEPFELASVSKYIHDFLPGLDSSYPGIVQKCKYTMTPDEVFILDRHPAHENIIIAVGFSGLGFKFAPVVGNILRDFVLRAPHKYNMDAFTLDRFNKANPVKH